MDDEVDDNHGGCPGAWGSWFATRHVRRTGCPPHRRPPGRWTECTKAPGSPPQAPSRASLMLPGWACCLRNGLKGRAGCCFCRGSGLAAAWPMLWDWGKRRRLRRCPKPGGGGGRRETCRPRWWRLPGRWCSAGGRKPGSSCPGYGCGSAPAWAGHVPYSDDLRRAAPRHSAARRVCIFARPVVESGCEGTGQSVF
jgi:hypothetical protein